MDLVVPVSNIDLSKETIIIQVQGGNVISAHSNNPDLKIIVVDYDNINEGDSHPFENDEKLSQILKDMKEIY